MQTAKERSEQARIAALTRWAREDPAANAARAQAGLRAKFVRQAREEDPGITDAEAERRGKCLYLAEMARVRLAKARKRRRPA